MPVCFDISSAIRRAEAYALIKSSCDAIGVWEVRKWLALMVTASSSSTRAFEYAAFPAIGHSSPVGAWIHNSRYLRNSSPSGIPTRVIFQFGCLFSKQSWQPLSPGLQNSPRRLIPQQVSRSGFSHRR